MKALFLALIFGLTTFSACNQKSAEKEKATEILFKEIIKIQNPEYINWSAVNNSILAGADVNVVNYAGQTALIPAALAGQLGTVQLLLEKGADVNANDKYGTTGLMAAAESGHLKTVNMLLGHGAAVNAKTSDRYYYGSGWTALHWASKNNDLKVSKLLLDKGADVNAKTSKGESALNRAQSEELKQLLRSYGAKE